MSNYCALSVCQPLWYTGILAGEVDWWIHQQWVVLSVTVEAHTEDIGSFSEQLLLYMRLVLGAGKTSRSQHSPTRVLKLLQRPQLGSVAHVAPMVSATSYYLQAESPEQLPLWKLWAAPTFQRQGRGRGTSDSYWPAPRSGRNHILSITLPTGIYDALS